VMVTVTEMATAMATETATATGTETATGTAMAMETAMAMVTEMATAAGVATMRRIISLAAATVLLTACATGASETGSTGACPSLVAYAADFRERAASEIERLPEDSAIVAMLKDYASMREQARACAATPAGS